MSENEAKKETKKEETNKQSLLDRVLHAPVGEVMPWEDVVLPSKGVYYDGKIPDGLIQVRPMGLAEEKILATQRLAQTGQSIDLLFKSCVKFPNDFDPIDLLLGDRVFLLYYLRGITHGNEYEFVIKCSNAECGVSSTHTYDLNRLSKTIIRADDNLGQEPFKVVLPHMTKFVGEEFWVKVRFMRGYDISTMLSKKKVSKRLRGASRVNMEVDNSIEENMVSLIVEAAGETDRTKIRQLVGRLHSLDSSTIREFLKKNSPAVDTTITIECPDCGNEMRTELPITENFFRPSLS